MYQVSNDYQGEITSAAITEDDEGRVSAVVYVRADGSSETARWRGTFDETEIRQGTNQGRQWGEVTAECLGEFGITDFSRVADMAGMRCSFGIKHSPGKDKNGNPKIWVEVNFIHPIRVLKPVSSYGLAALNKFKGAAIDAARKNGARPPAPAPATARGSQSQRQPAPGSIAASNRGDAWEGDDADYDHDPLA